MSRRPVARPGRSHAGRLKAGVIAFALIAAGVFAPPTQPAAASVSCADTAVSDAQAARLAKACNRLVEVTSATSEHVRVVALPSGMLEWQRHVTPVRARRGGGWVPVDTRLQVTGDGRLAPAASTVEISFSRGGSGALASLAVAGGSAAMSWPGVLPTPTLEGDTAVYANVLPDVDLRLRATASGFTQVLVVKTPAGAAQPALRSIRYGWSAQGLTVRAQADGGVQVLDSAGGAVLSAAPGLMWDSSSAAVAGQGQMSAQQVRASASDASSPDDAARTAAVKVQVSASELTVTPDPAMLSAADNVFPLFIDPPVQAYKNRWGYANSANTNNNDGVGRLGNNPDGYGGVWRSYFEFDLQPLRGKNIYDSAFHAEFTHTSKCAATPVNLWTTWAMDAGVNGTRTGWAPAPQNWADEQWVEANAGCGDASPQPRTFRQDLTAHMQWWAANSTTVTLSLSTQRRDGTGEEKQSDTRFNNWAKVTPGSVSLTIWYNTPPNPPVAQGFNATTDCYKVCTSTIGMGTSGTKSMGWWKLNETSGTAAADSSPFSRHGTASGGVGWSDGAAVFNGSTTQIATAAPALDTTQSFSVSAWAKVADTGVGGTLLGQDASWRAGFELYYAGGDNWGFVKPAGDGNWGGAWLGGTTPTTTSTWVHLAAVYDRPAGVARLYVNGTLTDTQTAGSAFAAGGALTIGRGRYDNAPTAFFKGSVDGVQVYQHAVTGTDVTNLKNTGRAGGAITVIPAIVRTTVPTLQVDVSDPDPSPQLWTEFEVRTAPTESATVIARSPQLGPVGSPTTQSYAVPAGVLASGGIYYWRAYSRDEIGWNSIWSPFRAIQIDTSAPTGFGVSSTQYPKKQWGATVGTAGTFKLTASTDTAEFEWWVDGGAHATVNATNGTVSVSHTPAKDMVHTLFVKAKDAAGNVSAGTYEHQFWVAPLANRCWNWRLDNTSGTSATDSGNTDTNDALCKPIGSTVSAMPAAVSANAGGTAGWTPGHIGGGLQFTGSGGQAATAAPVLKTNESFTVMAWAKVSSLAAGDVQTVLSQAGTNTSGFQLQYRKDANGGQGGFCMTMFASDSGTAAPVKACSTTIPVAGEWVHLAGVYDKATQTITVYVGGDPDECAGSSSATPHSSPWTSGGPFLIGRAGTASVVSQAWIGIADDVYAFQRALPAGDICIRAVQ